MVTIYTKFGWGTFLNLFPNVDVYSRKFYESMWEAIVTLKKKFIGIKYVSKLNEYHNKRPTMARKLQSNM